MFVTAGCGTIRWLLQGGRNKAIAYDRRGFGETHAEPEKFSSVADLMAVVDAVAEGQPAILIGCSQGGKIALDAALQHPTRVMGLVLIAPSVGGAPEPVYSAEIKDTLAHQKAAEDAGDLDRVNVIKAHLWLDGPLAPEGRVTGEARQLFLDMNGIALRSPPVGLNHDTATQLRSPARGACPLARDLGQFRFPAHSGSVPSHRGGGPRCISPRGSWRRTPPEP